MKTIKLPEELYLVNRPESGMGYHIANIFLKNGQVLVNHKVINSELLLLNSDEVHITADDIEKIELVKN